MSVSLLAWVAAGAAAASGSGAPTGESGAWTVPSDSGMGCVHSPGTLDGDTCVTVVESCVPGTDTWDEVRRDHADEYTWRFDACASGGDFAFVATEFGPELCGNTSTYYDAAGKPVASVYWARQDALCVVSVCCEDTVVFGFRDWCGLPGSCAPTGLPDTGTPGDSAPPTAGDPSAPTSGDPTAQSGTATPSRCGCAAARVGVGPMILAGLLGLRRRPSRGA